VEQDEHAVRVGEVALVLLDARARHRPAQFGDERRPQQLREIEVRDVTLVVSPVGAPLAGVEGIDQRSPRIADRFDGFLDAALACVLDDEAGVGGDVGLEVGVDPFRIAGDHLDPAVVETAGEGPAFDKEVNLEARQEHLVERPDD
jgi:hypothetical protein